MELFQKFKNRHREESQTTRRSMTRFMDCFANARNDVRAVPERLPAGRQGVEAFTLVEIMIVVAIIALLASIAIPNLQRVRSEAQLTKMKQTLKLFVGAYELYVSSTGDYPTNMTSFTAIVPPVLSSEMANICSDGGVVVDRSISGETTVGASTVDGIKYSCGFSDPGGRYLFSACSELDLADGGFCYRIDKNATRTPYPSEVIYDFTSARNAPGLHTLMFP